MQALGMFGGLLILVGFAWGAAEFVRTMPQKSPLPARAWLAFGMIVLGILAMRVAIASLASTEG